MSIVVSFRNYDLMPRYDGKAWTQIKIYESNSGTGPWTTLIDTITIDPVAADPADPEPISFTTEKGTIQNGWYMAQILDATGDSYDTEPIQNVPAREIMATLDDVNAHLDGEVIEATPDNTDLVQVSVARLIRGYLGRMVDSVTLASWSTPDATPDIIREIASMLIAANVYFHESARTSLTIEDNNFAQRLYDQAIALLQGIIDGQITIDGGGGATNGEIVSPEILSIEDFFPIDATDRAFTMGQQF